MAQDAGRRAESTKQLLDSNPDKYTVTTDFKSGKKVKKGAEVHMMVTQMGVALFDADTGNPLDKSWSYALLETWEAVTPDAVNKEGSKHKRASFSLTEKKVTTRVCSIDMLRMHISRNASTHGFRPSEARC